MSVITNDGRNIVGVLRGFDTTTNLILDDCHERVYSSKARRPPRHRRLGRACSLPPLQAGVEQVALGLYVVRGDNICVVGELDESLDANLDLNAITAPPLKPVTH